MTASALLAEEITRRFRNGRGVGPVSLRVERGEVVSLIGPNGSGKTTLLRCLATRSRPQMGVVSWFGDPSRDAARRHLAVVFDATANADELTGRENLAFFSAARGVPAKDAEQVLQAAEIAEVGDEPVAAYSYGMRRRLLLAEALAGDPPLLLLDEPTLGLDVSGQRWLTRALKRRSQAGLATCVSTNDTQFVEQVATRVCFLVEGRVVHDAPLLDLLDSLGGTRQILLTSREALPLAQMRSIPGVEAVAATGDGATVVAKQREGLLADLLATLGDLDRSLLDLSVREPGLADCFLRITGRPLDD